MIFLLLKYICSTLISDWMHLYYCINSYLYIYIYIYIYHLHENFFLENAYLIIEICQSCLYLVALKHQKFSINGSYMKQVWLLTLVIDSKFNSSRIWFTDLFKHWHVSCKNRQITGIGKRETKMTIYKLYFLNRITKNVALVHVIFSMMADRF